MIRIVSLLGIFLISLLFSACAPKSVLPEKPITTEALPIKPEATVKEPWEVKWEKTLAEAKKEGSLVIGTGRSEAMRDIIGKAFKNKYGIDIIWMTGPTGLRAAKMASERKAGIYATDIGIDGGNPAITMYKAWDILEPLPLNFILPEVKDQSAWLDGKFPFIDSEGMYVFSMTLYPQSPILYNTDLVKPEEFSSYQKLLDPKWKGNFVMGNITTVGAANKWFGAMVEKDFGPILGLDYMRALAKQEPIILQTEHLAAEWIMRGKHPFGLNLMVESQLSEWRRQGIRVPMAAFTPKEGGYTTSGGQVLTFFKNAPHPRAARIFINWVLSKEGAIAMTRASIKHNARIDIGDPRKIEPEVIMREPGVNYVHSDQEKYLLKTDEYTKLATEIFGPSLK